MKKFLIGIIATIFLCCGAAGISACSGGKSDDGSTPPVSEYLTYEEGIEYRYTITSDAECPNGELREDRLHENLDLEQGEIYYLVLDCKISNFYFAEDNFVISTSVCDSNLLDATLHEAATGNIKEGKEDYIFLITTRYSVPQNRMEEKNYRIVYEVTMTEGLMFTANMQIDSMKLSDPFAVGYDLEFELNKDNSSYAVEGFSGKAVESLAIPAYYGTYPVTAIGEGAFQDCDGMGEITLSENIVTIEDYAFSGCADLYGINVPDGLTSIGGYAFNNCIQLSSPDFGGDSALSSIGEYAFSGCIKLGDLTIPKSVKNIGANAFYNCLNLTRIYLSDIKAWCEINFSGNFANPLCYEGNLYLNNAIVRQLIIPAGVTKINSYAFIGYADLNSVTIGSDVASIGSYAFYGCEGIERITVPKNVTSISFNAFGGCDNLISITLPFIGDGTDNITHFGYIFGADTYVGNGNFVPDGLSSVTITGGDVIGSGAFYGCDGLKTVNIPDSVTKIGANAFGECLSLGITKLSAGLTSIGDYAFAGCGNNFSSVEIPAKVTSLDNGAFSDCTNLSSVKFDDLKKVGKLGDEVFKNCSKLNNITIPDSVTSIGKQAFYKCSKLSKIIIPDAVTSIGEEAFASCTILASAEIGSGMTSVGGKAFDNCSSLSKIALPAKVASVGLGAFGGCKLLSSITLPFIGNGSDKTHLSWIFGAEDYKDSAKYVPASLKTVVLTGGREIPQNAFNGCAKITAVTVPDGIMSVGEGAFLGCSGLKEISLPGGVTSIGKNAFSGCNYLSGVTLPKSIKTIGEDAFAKCPALLKVNIRDINAWCGVTLANANANPLSNSGDLYIDNVLTENLVIPAEITNIADYAFYNCKSIKGLEIPAEVKTIGRNVFGGCSNLANLTLPFIGDGTDNITHFGWLFGAEDYLNNRNCMPESLQTVTLTGGTAIPDRAFYSCSPIKKVVVPDSVTVIGMNAFYNCSALNAVEFGADSKLEEIGASAFSGCAKLSKISMPKGVTKVGYSAFFNCTSLTSVYITDMAAWCGTAFSSENSNPLYFARKLYLNNNASAKFEIPSSVKKVGDYAFINCTSITNIVLQEGTTEIGNGSFSGCTNLTGITVPGGLTSMGERAFYNCSRLGSITVPESVKSIGKDAFYNCSSLKGVYITDLSKWCGISFGNASSNPVNSAPELYLDNVPVTKLAIPADVAAVKDYAFYNCTHIKEITIPENVKTIGSYAFGKCSGITQLTVPKTVTSLGLGAFEGCSLLSSITLPYIGDGTDSRTHFGYIFGAGNYSAHSAYVPASLKTVEITGGKVISQNAFNGCANITGVILPDGITSVGDGAFAGCTNLKTITLPEGVTSIGANAFNKCTNLASITLPKSLKSVGGEAFAGCTHLIQLYIPDLAAWCAVAFENGYANPLSHSGKLYVDNNLVESLVIPAGVTKISDYAFYDCDSIKSAEIPAGVTSVGKSAFYSCSNLASITLPYTGNGSDKTHFGYIFGADKYTDNSTYVPTSLKTVVVTGGKEISQYAFFECINVTSVTVKDGITSIGANAFAGCKNLTSVTLPEGVTSIGANAFNQCTILANVSLPQSVISIGDYAFGNCKGIKSFEIPAKVKTVGKNAFTGCTNLASIKLPFTGDGAEITHFGYIFGADKYTDNYLNVPMSLKTVEITGGKEISQYALYRCEYITAVTVSDGITAIGNSAFNGCKNLTSITLPEGITSIGENAFNQCKNLSSVTMPKSLKSIGENAFASCSYLSQIYISDLAAWCGITFGNAEANPLNNGGNLYIDKTLNANLAIPAEVTKISDYAFYNCKSIKSAEISGEVTSIGKSAFYKCSNLSSVTLPESLKSIGENAFANCTYLSQIYISDLAAWCGITFGSANANPLNNGGNLYVDKTLTANLVIPAEAAKISAYAFCNCKSIKSVVIPAEVKTIGENVFDGCTNLASIKLPYIGDGTDSRTHFGWLFGAERYEDNNSYIPTLLKTVEITGGKEIPQNAFFRCNYITTVTVSDGITAIGESAFSGCTNLSTITLAEGVSSIGESAFSGCTYLRTITLPEGVSSIGKNAFNKCPNLASITLPKSLKSIGEDAFANCTYLSKLYISDLAAWCTVTFTNEYANPFGNFTSGKLYVDNTLVESLVIPAGVTSIGDYAFYNFKGIKSAEIPAGVKTIGKNVFTGCTNLASIKLPFTGNGSDKTHLGWLFGAEKYEDNNSYIPTLLKTVEISGGEKIPAFAFYNCSRLTSVIVGDGVKQIGESAFCNCTGLTGITLPKETAQFDSNAFKGCEKLNGIYLTDISAWCAAHFADENANPLYNAHHIYLSNKHLDHLNIPDGVTEISDYAFVNCKGVSTVTIPSSVIRIGGNAFKECTQVINVRGGVQYIDKWIIHCDVNSASAILDPETKGIADYAFENCKNLTSITLPESVTSIGMKAFKGCENIANIKIPDNVVYIGDYAFCDCLKLSSAVIGSGVTSIGINAFQNCTGLSDVAFKDTTGWKVSKNADMTGSADVTFAGAAGNAALLSDKYCSYYWKRYDNKA